MQLCPFVELNILLTFSGTETARAHVARGMHEPTLSPLSHPRAVVCVPQGPCSGAVLLRGQLLMVLLSPVTWQHLRRSVVAL